MSRLLRPLPILTFFACAVLAWPSGQAGADTRAMQDWKVTCDRGNCAAHHESRGVQIVVVVPPDSDRRRILLRLNPRAGIGDPVAIRLEGGWYASLGISDCDERTCLATVKAEAGPEVEQAFKRARSGVVAYRAGATMVIAPISLAGFTEALSAVPE